MLKKIGCVVRIVSIASAVALAATTQAAAIFRGRTAPPRAYPFMASMRIQKGGSTYLCGGSLIAEQWVLTAAHCLDGVSSPNDVHVFVGSDKRWDGDEILAGQFWMHPGFNDLIDNDVALIRLARPPGAGLTVSTIKLSADLKRYEDLPPGNDALSPAGASALLKSIHRDVTVAGWGLITPTKASEILPEVLQVVDLRIPQSRYCELRWTLPRLDLLQNKFDSFGLNRPTVESLMNVVLAASPHGVPAGTLCASSLVDMFGEPVGSGLVGALLGKGPETVRDVWDPKNLRLALQRIPITTDPGDCPGDSGGPLFETDSNGGFLQVGIVSFGIGNDSIECGSATAPSVYTSVASFDAWIRSVMSGR